MLIGKLAIIGVGLIGGSLARALNAAGACSNIVGYDSDLASLEKAVDLGVITGCSSDIAVVVADADIVVLATPLSATEPLLRELAGVLEAGTIVTDTGSAKGSVVRTARAVLGDKSRQFIPGHPIAGTEQSGVEASFPELFRDHLVILTPLEENDPAALRLVTRMWESCGATVLSLSINHHDQVLAATSHLPHMLAYALVACLAEMDESEEIFRFSAGGFRDFTRIASSSPEMWSDVCIANRENLLQVIDSFKSCLDIISGYIEAGDREHLLELFSRAKDSRDRYLSGQGIHRIKKQ